jgi:hypothetical protein
MKSVVRTGVPVITDGVIIGLPDDDNESLLRLEEAVTELMEVNPQLEFQISCYSIAPLPGTPQSQNLRASGLLQFEDPCVWGGLWTPTCNTHRDRFEVIISQGLCGQIGRSCKAHRYSYVHRAAIGTQP